jgi:RecA-family ATPase
MGTNRFQEAAMQTDQLAKILLAVFLSARPDLKDWIDSLLATLTDQQKAQFMKDLLTIDINQPLPDLLQQAQDIGRDISFQLHTAAEAFEPRGDMDWLIDGLALAGSISVLVGEPGSGKTWAMLHLALSIASGNTWLNKDVKTGPVLWIDAESGKHRMLERLEKVMTGFEIRSQEIPFYFITAGDRLMDLRKVDDLNYLQGLIVQTGASLCVVDALADVMPGADENSVKDVQPLFVGLRKLVDTTGCAFLLIHHTNKNGGYRGSTAIAGAVDLMMQVTREGKEHLRFESKKARDSEPFSFVGKMAWSQERFEMILGLDSGPAYTFNEAERFVVRYLLEHETATTPEVMADAEANGLKPNSVRKAFPALKEKGVIERTNPDAPNATPARFRLIRFDLAA